MMDDIENSAERYLTAGKFFQTVAANDRFPRLGQSDMPNGFLPEELQAIHEAIYPYGASLHRSAVTMNGVDYSGERIDVCIPLSGDRSDSHVLNISKVLTTGAFYIYQTEFVQTRATLQTSLFSQAMKNAARILKISSMQEQLGHHHTYNG